MSYRRAARVGCRLAALLCSTAPLLSTAGDSSDSRRTPCRCRRGGQKPGDWFGPGTGSRRNCCCLRERSPRRDPAHSPGRRWTTLRGSWARTCRLGSSLVRSSRRTQRWARPPRRRRHRKLLGSLRRRCLGMGQAAGVPGLATANGTDEIRRLGKVAEIVSTTTSALAAIFGWARRRRR
jgi:hypothetical protein